MIQIKRLPYFLLVFALIFCTSCQPETESKPDTEEKTETKTINNKKSTPTKRAEKKEKAKSNKQVVKTSPKVNSEKPTTKISETSRPDIKRTSPHAAIAMSYLSMSSSKVQSAQLRTCIQDFKAYRLTEAGRCLRGDFGAAESQAEWFRGLLALTIDGRPEGERILKKISDDKNHVFSMQATSLVQALNR